MPRHKKVYHTTVEVEAKISSAQKDTSLLVACIFLINVFKANRHDIKLTIMDVM